MSVPKSTSEGVQGDDVAHPEANNSSSFSSDNGSETSEVQSDVVNVALGISDTSGVIEGPNLGDSNSVFNNSPMPGANERNIREDDQEENVMMIHRRIHSYRAWRTTWQRQI